MNTENEGQNKEATVTLPAEESTAVEEKPTSAELETQGFTPEEIKSAEEKGLIGKPGEKKPGEEEADALKKKSEEEAEGKQDPIDPLKEADPENEHKQWEEFTPKERASYFQAKRERKKRQATQVELDRALIQNQRNEERLTKVEQKQNEKDDPGSQDESVLGEGGTRSRPGEKSLTKADLEEFEKEKLEKQRKTLEEKQARSAKLGEVTQDQELDAKAKHEDFDKATNLANEIFKNANHLEKLFPERVARRGIEALIGDFLKKASNADTIEEGEETAAEIGYEIGRLHPDYKKLNADGSKSGEGESGAASNDPEKVKRALEESRQSSAKLTGGGSSRVVSVNNLTTAEVLALPHTEFIRLRKEHPEVIERLKRG